MDNTITCDVIGDGEVDYDEFCNLMKDVVVSTPSHHDISEAFKVWEKLDFFMYISA